MAICLGNGEFVRGKAIFCQETARRHLHLRRSNRRRALSAGLSEYRPCPPARRQCFLSSSFRRLWRECPKRPASAVPKWWPKPEATNWRRFRGATCIARWTPRWTSSGSPSNPVVASGGSLPALRSGAQVVIEGKSALAPHPVSFCDRALSETPQATLRGYTPHRIELFRAPAGTRPRTSEGTPRSLAALGR